MKEVGIVHGDLLVKSDQEPAIKAILDDAGRVRSSEGGGRYIMEQSPVGSSASNGVVERAILSIEQQVRVMKSAVESRWGVKLETKHPAIPWMVEHSAALLNRFEVSHDGKTAYERRKQRRCRLEVVHFGERAWYKQIRDGKGRKDKFESEERTCIWLGHARTSNEVLIGTADGVVRAYSVSRRPVELRWSADDFNNISGSPQQPNPNKPGGIIPVRVRFDAPEERGGNGGGGQKDRRATHADIQ